MGRVASYLTDMSLTFSTPLLSFVAKQPQETRRVRHRGNSRQRSIIKNVSTGEKRQGKKKEDIFNFFSIRINFCNKEEEVTGDRLNTSNSSPRRVPLELRPQFRHFRVNYETSLIHTVIISCENILLIDFINEI